MFKWIDWMHTPHAYFQSMCGFVYKNLEKFRKEGNQLITSGSQKGADERGKECSPPGQQEVLGLLVLCKGGDYD